MDKQDILAKAMQQAIEREEDSTEKSTGILIDDYEVSQEEIPPHKISEVLIDYAEMLDG